MDEKLGRIVLLRDDGVRLRDLAVRYDLRPDEVLRRLILREWATLRDERLGDTQKLVAVTSPHASA